MGTCGKKTPESSWEEPPLLNPKIHAGRAGPAIAVKTLLKGLSRFLRHLRLAGFNEGVFWFSRKRMLMIVCSQTVDVKDDKARVPHASGGVIVGGFLRGQTRRWYPNGKPSQNMHFEHGLVCTAAVWCHDDGNDKVFHLNVRWVILPFLL